MSALQRRNRSEFPNVLPTLIEVESVNLDAESRLDLVFGLKKEWQRKTGRRVMVTTEQLPLEYDDWSEFGDWYKAFLNFRSKFFKDQVYPFLDPHKGKNRLHVLVERTSEVSLSRLATHDLNYGSERLSQMERLMLGNYPKVVYHFARNPHEEILIQSTDSRSSLGYWKNTLLGQENHLEKPLIQEIVSDTKNILQSLSVL